MRRDAEITRSIYERHPVLVDRSGSEVRRAWPVKYVRMFDMTNDSGLFRTAAQLETKGFYPVEGNRWKRGEELYLPLYEGKMVQAFDHRAASVVVNSLVKTLRKSDLAYLNRIRNRDCILYPGVAAFVQLHRLFTRESILRT